MESTLLLWVAFAVFIVGMLALDLFVFHRDAHEVNVREAAVFSAVWDGRSASGGIVPTGLYICVVEFMAPGGGVCRREKRCIAVSDGG